MECPTVKVKFDNEQGYFVINEADFDAAKHELFTKPPATETPQTEVAAKPPATETPQTEVAAKPDEPAPAVKTPDAGGVVPKQPWGSKKDKP